MKVTTTNVTQSANEILGKKETVMYYLIVENNIGKKLIINVGKKTHDEIQLLNETESVETKQKEVKK